MCFIPFQIFCMANCLPDVFSFPNDHKFSGTEFSFDICNVCHFEKIMVMDITLSNQFNIKILYNWKLFKYYQFTINKYILISISLPVVKCNLSDDYPFLTHTKQQMSNQKVMSITKVWYFHNFQEEKLFVIYSKWVYFHFSRKGIYCRNLFYPF